jgi:hypothetical protein
MAAASIHVNFGTGSLVILLFTIIWFEFKSLGEIIDSGINGTLSAMAAASIHVNFGTGSLVILLFTIIWFEFKSLGEIIDSGIKVPLSVMAAAFIQAGCSLLNPVIFI